MVRPRIRFKGRMVAADTIAFFLFSALTASLPAMWEMLLADTTAVQSLAMRGATISLTLVPKFLFARLLGLLADFLQRVASKISTNPVAKATANGLSMWIYQMPIYVLGANMVGLTWQQICIVQGVMFLETPLVGWIYRFILDATRSYLAPKKPQV